MNTKLLHAVTLGALLSLASAPHAFAMDHSKMDHAGMGHGTPAGEKPGSASLEIRKTVVNAYTLTYTLIDLKQMMAAAKMTQAHDMSKMKSHHLMVYPARTGSAPISGGKAGFLVVQPDKTEVKAMAMFMEGGFGADLDLVAKGDYKITTKIVLGDTTLVDEFVHTVK